VWVRDVDSADAEVDHRGQSGGVAVAVAAALYDSDFGVDAFESGVGQSEFDRGGHGVEVFA
jgi:hypothetical protein